MAQSLLQRGKDNLANGAVLGGITGALIIYGQRVYDWLVPLIPESWIGIFPDGYGIPVILIGIGVLLGYIIDRN